MSKTRTLNKTITTILILLLTLSILSVINFITILPVEATFVTTDTIYVSANYTHPDAGNGSSTNPYGSIRWALLNCTGNAIIHVSPGTYNDTIEQFPLTIADDNVTLVSTGTREETIINATGSSSIINIIEFAHRSDTAIEGFTIMGDGNQERCIHGVSVTNTTIRDNVLTGVSKPAAQGFCQSGGRLLIEDNIFTSTRRGMYLTSAPEGVIRNNTIENMERGIILGTGNCSYMTITNNTIRNMTKTGIHPTTPPPAQIHGTNITYNNIQGCTLYGVLSLNTTWNLNATYNWWGDPMGPGNETLSCVGDYVSDNVTYTPWLTVPHALDETAALNIYPTTGPPGLYVGLSSQAGTFTGASTNVTFYFGGVAIGSVMAESTGAMNGTLKVPERTAGPYTVRALGNDTNSASTSFTITSPTITVSPTRGSVGTTVTITGTSWNCSGTVDVDISNSTYSTDLVTGMPNCTGIFTNTTTIPSLAIGVYTINATDGINTAAASFTIPSRTITLNVTSGPPSLPVLVTGEGFTKNGLVDIYFDTTLVTSTSGSVACGNISTTFTVPAKTAVDYTVKAHDVVANKNATADFTIPSPSINLYPTQGLPGKTIDAWGANWNCSGTVSIYFDSTAVLSPANNQANATGYLGETANMTFVVPDLTNGTYTVNATDGINSDTSLSFTIPDPTLWLNTTGGPVAATIMINGTNWKLGATVDIDIYNSTYSQDLLTATAHATYGNFTDTFTVPSLVIGTYTINATDHTTNTTAEIGFNIGCAITINPTSGPANSTITVNGQGFTVGANHTIWWDNTLKKTVNATDGTFTTTFTIPNQAADTHNVWANDTVTGFRTANVTFTVNTPSITLSPNNGTAGTLVTVTGTNFQINSTVTIKFDSMIVNNTATTDHTGAFTATFNVPSNYTGAAYTINATASAYINSATATFTVTGGTGIGAVLDLLRHTTYGLEEIKNEIVQILANLAIMQTDITTIKGYVQVINWTDITYIKTEVDAIEAKLDNSTYGLVAIKDAVDAINFTALETKVDAIKLKTDTINWTDITAIKTAVETNIPATLTAIKAKTDTINWADITTILTKVTNIEDKLILAPSEIKFDFGTQTSLWEPGFIQVTPSTNYSTTLGYGWTNTTDLDARDRSDPDYVRRDFVFSSLNKTFQVDLANGNYTVIITMGDQSYAHNNMTIYAEGTLKATVSTSAGTFVQKVFTVSVTDGNLTLEFVDTVVADPNWVINSLIIQRSWK